MTIRPATEHDLPAIMDLENTLFPTDAWASETMRAELASPHTTYLVDDDAGDVIGYAGLRVVGADGDIQTIGVRGDAQRRGTGRTLLRTLIDRAREQHARQVFLDVRVDNPAAIALYDSEGFVEIGRRRGYYQPDGVDAVVMRLDLTRGEARDE